MSPLPKMGIRMRGLAFTFPIRVQSASPLYSWARVRPWMLRAWMPMSCRRSATSSMLRLASSQPRRVFTVTGSFTAFTTASVRRTILSTSSSRQAPAPLLTTFFTGQP